MTATITKAPYPLSLAAVKIANFPVKPLVSGIPAKANRNSAKVLAIQGDVLPKPAHWLKCVASPEASRTSETTANAPNVVKP